MRRGFGILPASIGGGLVKVVGGRVTTTTTADQKADAGRRSTIKPVLTPKKKSSLAEAANENEVLSLHSLLETSLPLSSLSLLFAELSTINCRCSASSCPLTHDTNFAEFQVPSSLPRLCPSSLLVGVVRISHAVTASPLNLWRPSPSCLYPLPLLS
jgi:hypothetical protein